MTTRSFVPVDERDIVRRWLNENLTRLTERESKVPHPWGKEEIVALKRCIALLDVEDSMEESHAYAMRHDP